MMKIKSRRATVLLCSAAVAVLTTSAFARPVHHHHRQRAVLTSQAAGAEGDVRYSVATATAGETVVQDRGHSRRSRADARVRAQSHSNSAYGGATSNSLVSEARRYIGTNPTGRGSLWCGAFMDLVLKRTGHAGGGNLASAYARYGTRVSGPQVGAIAVMGRRGGGHVGVVSGVDPNGNPIIVSATTITRLPSRSIRPAVSAPTYCPAADRSHDLRNNDARSRAGVFMVFQY